MGNILELIEQMNQTIPGENQVFVDKRERIMTKDEARKFLENKKVYVGKHSRIIQKKLAEAGFRWIYGPDIQNERMPFLYTDETGYITYGYNAAVFHFTSPNKEITAEEILSIEIKDETEKKPELKPFDRVLYKFEKEGIWRAGLYSHREGDRHVISGVGYRKYVIPYKGNEDKLGKITD